MKFFNAAFSFFFALAFILLLHFKFGVVPPVGKFLDPFNGFWQNAETREQDATVSFKNTGIKGKVTIRFDERRIPHIFAENDYDLYFAQGYVTARDRLWQMDFQTRFAAGRLSEVVGPVAIELDRYQRRMGMVYGAENMVKEMQNDPQIMETMQAFADGINAYIGTLKPKDYPIEFKILDYKPEEWKIINSALLLKLMSATLASGSNEFYMNNILSKYGPEVTANLFPDYPVRENPIIPKGTKWDFKPVPIPAAPENNPTATASAILTRQHDEGIGSNNWAVSGTRSATGYPILANDPHLDLTLPAIWYQVQLASAGVNVCGVSIPGAPGVIIGFNKDVAWGVTNVGADVLDWYSIKFKDQSRSQYWYNGAWKATTKKIETIAVKGAGPVSDTVYYTHHGPVVYMAGQKPPAFSKADNIPEGYALRWVAHDPSNDTRTFYLLNRARTYDDYRKALTYYTAPAQNFLFASADDDIAITPNGYFPLKWKDQGKFLLDGSDPANEWQGRIPAAQNPTVKNPPRGFASSANQFPADQTYPYYINWEFSGYERAERINRRLTVMKSATADSLRNLQNDNYSILAENILPVLLQGITVDDLNASERQSFGIVSKWNRFFDAGQVGASIFEIWQKLLGQMIWADEFTDQDAPMRYPSRDRTVEMLLNEPDARWFDDVNTPQKETRNNRIQAAFVAAVDSLERRFGPIDKDWQWGNVKHSQVPHLAKIAGFGSGFINNGGSKTSVNAMAESNGPSWRMVVELGRQVKAFGVFPGGESGNPGSFFYDDMVAEWSRGEMKQLLFLQTVNQPSNRIITTWALEK